MATVEADSTWLGVQLELSNDEVQAVTSGLDIEQALHSLTGVLPAVYDTALAVAARYLSVEAPTVQDLDQGRGVSLLIPWLAIWWGHWWLIIANTR
jgi:hypothetical protein